MSVTVLVLYTKATGHVLAATTAVAPLADKVKPEALAGDFLPVRHNGNPAVAPLTYPVAVPASEFTVASIDGDVVPITAARGTFYDADKKTPFPLTSATPSIDLAQTNSTKLTIKFTPASTSKTSVWARIDPINPLPGSQVTAQTVSADVTPPNLSQLSVPLTLSPLLPGDYGVLALVPGFVPLLQKITI